MNEQPISNYFVWFTETFLRLEESFLKSSDWFKHLHIYKTATESGLECACVNSDNFAALGSGGGRWHWACVLCGCCIQNDWVEQWICIKFCVKLEHCSMETIQMIQKAASMATGDWQLHRDHMPTHASCFMQSFLAKHQITQVTQPLYSPDLASCDFWLFPKLKSPLKRKRFQTFDGIQKNITG